jgi:hypothetical protein
LWKWLGTFKFHRGWVTLWSSNKLESSLRPCSVKLVVPLLLLFIHTFIHWFVHEFIHFINAFCQNTDKGHNNKTYRYETTWKIYIGRRICQQIKYITRVFHTIFSTYHLKYYITARGIFSIAACMYFIGSITYFMYLAVKWHSIKTYNIKKKVILPKSII